MKPVSHRPARVVLSLLAVLVATLAHGAERGPVRRALPAAAAETEARVIVKFRDDSTLKHALSVSAGATAPGQHAQALSMRLGLSLRDGRSLGALRQVVKGSGMSSQDLAERLAAQADVEYAVVDGRKHALALPNDPLYGVQTTATPAVGQWYLRAPNSATIVDATSVVSAINAEAAWTVTNGSAGVVVAVLDTGVRRDHPDLAPKLLAGYDFISSTDVSGDGTGRDTDPSDPGDYVGTGTSSWHGTQTSGLIGAATNNGIGMASSGRDVMVLPVRVLGKNGGFDSDIQAAMLWAAGLSADPVVNPNPARVVNLSLGGTGACSAAYLDTIRRLNAAGVVVIAAAGNEGVAVGTPANCSGAIAVAGVRHAGSKVGYSDLGPEIAIAAPAGNCVNLSGACLYPLLTTSNSGTTVPVVNGAGGSIYTGSGSDASLGTSFAAPLVAGTVGLMLSVNPTLTPAQVLAALKASARAFPASGSGVGVTACQAPVTGLVQDSECYCTTSTCGAGLLDAGAAVTRVAVTYSTIAVASTSVASGAAVTLDGSGSRAGLGGSAIVGYLWSVSGAGATFSSATNASTAVLQTSAGGAVVVSLTVTDAAGRQATSSTTLTVSDTTPPVTPPSSGGGGGGAMAWGWLLGWLAAVAGVRAVTPRQRRA